MNGIICIYKTKGRTSFDVVSDMRKLCKTRKIGHGGTLDPMAEGVLPIFIGNATKAVDFTPSDEKEYIAGFKFGLTTDTQDITGNVLSQNDAYVSRNKMIFVERFKGEIKQIPPMYSAVQIDGVRLYNLARKGVTVEREPRTVTIHDIKVIEYRDNEGIMRVNCSRGTYIRTLIHDIGQELGAGAVMTSLIRTKSGPFTVENSHTIDSLQEGLLKNGAGYIENLLIPLEKFFGRYPKAYLDYKQTWLFGNGTILDANRIKFDKIYDGIYSVFDCNNSLAALAKITPDHNLSVIQRFQPPNMTIAKGVKKNLNE